MLELKHVRCGYGEVEILKGVSLTVKENEIVTIVGANAAGKSTLINTISGAINLWGGEILWNGEPLSAKSFDVVEAGIVQVPEGRQLFPFMSVYENLMLGAYNRHAREKASTSIEMVYGLFPILKERSKQMAGSLSGGEQQMCAIGRGLMACPKLLILDEPSLGLAPIIVKQIFTIIEQINQQGVSILLSEQNVLQSLKLSNRGYVLEQGKIVMEGKSADLINDDRLKVAYLGM